MLLSLENLFPDIPKFREVNLNNWLKAHCAAHPQTPENFQKAIDVLTHESGMPTYGGWMEYREWMWSDSYMNETKKFTHLGIDVYLHRGTPVQLPFDVTVLNTFYDEDCEVGWGGRITVQSHADHHAIVLGHLEPNLPAAGTRLPAHAVIGHLAGWPENGNVFEHLHIQFIRPTLVSALDWDALDGYGFKNQAEDFPHPFQTEV
jgi:hypothetical protein